MNRAATIATVGPAAYLRRVSLTRLIRFLTIVALALSPLATFVAAPASAMAHHAAMATDGHQMAGHEMPGHDMTDEASTSCQDMHGQSKDQPCRSGDAGDCMKACAAVPAIPAVGG